MRFFAAVAVALAGSAVAQVGPNDPTFDQINLPDTNEKVPAGKPYTIKWTVPSTAPSGPVTIVLCGGSSAQTLQNISTIACKFTTRDLMGYVWYFVLTIAFCCVAGVENSLGEYVWAVGSTLGDQAAYGLKVILEANNTRWGWSKGFKIAASLSSSSSSSSASTSSVYSTSSPTSHVDYPTPTTTSAPLGTGGGVVIQTSTSIVHGNSTVVSPTPKPTGSLNTGLASHATAGVAAIIGGLAIAMLGTCI